MSEPNDHADVSGQYRQCRGPANWFTFQCPCELEIRDNAAFLEIRPRAEHDTESDAAWSLTLYAVWVKAEAIDEQSRSIDVAAVFPSLLKSRQLDPLPMPCATRVWTGMSRTRKAASGWKRWFRRYSAFEWKLWTLEHQEVMVVASLQGATGMALTESTAEICDRLLRSIEFATPLARPPAVFRRDVVELAHRHFPLLNTTPTGSFSIHVEGSEINLTNFYRSYLLRPDRFQQIVLPALTTMVRLQEWGPDQLMPPLTAVRERLMPMLHPESGQPDDLEEFVQVPWVGGLRIMYVIDEDDSYRFVHNRLLDQWGSCSEELHEIALANLDTYVRKHPLKVTMQGDADRGLLLVPAEPCAYNSTRILWSGFHDRLRETFGAEFLVGVPNRDFFVAVSVNPPEMLESVKQRIVQDYESMHHPLTRRLLVISADGVSEYQER